MTNLRSNRVVVTLDVAVEVDRWALEFGLEPDRDAVRDDLRAYLEGITGPGDMGMPALEGIATITVRARK